MYKNLLGLLAAALIIPSCSDNSPSISVSCEENSVGNCVLVWETTPAIQGKVKIYASTNPRNIPEKVAVAVANIADQRTTIVPGDPTQRYYYKMVFNNRHRVTAATRNINIPGIQNFRDLGGYATNKGKEVRWGMVYRSGEMDNLPYSSLHELKNIGIKTIIDLRANNELCGVAPLKENGFNVIHIPVGVLSIEKLVQQLRAGTIRNDSISKLIMELNREFVTLYREEFKRVFEVLLEKENYPVVINSVTGKEKVGLASALLLSSLGVSDDNILFDYQLNNKYFDIPKASNFGYSLPVNAQEAITTLYSAREDFINAAKAQIEKNYGDVATYLQHGLELSGEDLRHIRSILLE